jgi:hypothetical protein
MDQLPFRQIHLDFHTSEAIPGVGKDWDKAHFQEMLKLGHVSSITVFSKCHHGWSYHPTEVALSETHPSLKPGLDLTGEMIKAAHEIGVQTPVYISAGLDEKLARTHSGWLRVLPDGTTTWSRWLDAGYHEFCMRSPYLDYLIEQTVEVVKRYDLFEGLFMDIVGVRDCCCQYCYREMVKRGMDPRNGDDRMTLGRETYINYARKINEAVHAIKPQIRVFHNGGHIIRGDRELAFLNTHHFELESLPTGGWGYDHFPLSARYIQGLGFEFLGMTGKFHTTWGEFGGYKHPNALRYETALSLANGAKISVGDQMHPFGQLDKATYTLIGAGFAEVEQKEPWCTGVTSIADIGVFSIEAFASHGAQTGPSTSTGMADAGVIRILQEGGLLYDVLDSSSDLSKYKLLILPDAIPVCGEFKTKLNAFIANGGKIFASWESALNKDKNGFNLDFGVEYKGQSTLSPEYIIPKFELENWANGAFVMYSQAKEITATTATVMAELQHPFFNRDMLHFCSHQHAPNTFETAGPAMVSTANTVYVAFPVFHLYADKGQNVLRDIVLQGIRALLPEATLTTNLPAQGVQTVMYQKAENRTIVHLLYVSPVKRGQGIEVIEDILPVYNVQVNLRVTKQPSRVYLAPQGTDLPFTVENGVLNTVLPELCCHQMVVVE